MEERINLSFERNHYFYGKLLSVSDFQLEQQYHNDKRRLLPALLFSGGFLAGFHTEGSGDNAVRVEAGVALDYLGREVVSDKPVTKRLQLIPGYSGTSSKGYTYLCVEYEETLEERVHSLEDKSQHQAFNKVKEGCRFYLTEEEPQPWDQPVQQAAFDTRIIWKNRDFLVAATAPRYVRQGQRFPVTVGIFPQIEQHALVKVEGELKSLSLFDDGGNSRIAFSLEMGQSDFQRQIWLRAEGVEEEMVSLEMEAASLRVSVDGDPMDALSEGEAPLFRWLISLVESPEEKIKESYYKLNLEDLLAARLNRPASRLCLARIHYITYENSCVISEVEAFPFKQFLLPDAVRRVAADSQWEREGEQEESDRDYERFKREVLERYQELNLERAYCTTGQTSVKLEGRGKKNTVHYSEEIAHGLGEGAVHMAAALVKEEILEDTVVFGDPALFEEGDIPDGFPQVETAIMLRSSKGVFRIAVKLLESTDLRELKLVWHAVSSRHVWGQGEEISLEIHPSVVKLASLEEVRLTLEGLPGEGTADVSWSVMRKGSGKISKGGVYTAPSTPGVYEIQAQAAGRTARAFAIVESLRQE